MKEDKMKIMKNKKVKKKYHLSPRDYADLAFKIILVIEDYKKEKK